MVKFCLRGTTRKIDDSDWDYDTKLNDLFPVDQWAKVYNVHNVIDIVVLSYNGNFYSISPKTFATKMEQYANDNVIVSGFYAPPNNGAKVTGYIANGKENDYKSPLGGPSQKGEEMVRYISDDEWAAWNGDKESNKYRPFLKDTGEFNTEANRWSALYEDILYQATLDSKKQRDGADFNMISDQWWRYNQMSRLVNNIASFEEAVGRGYKFFDPRLQNRINYIKKLFSSENHMLVMYLDAKTAALSWGCFNNSRDSSISKTVMTKLFQSNNLSNHDSMLKMGSDHCSVPLPSYSVWGVGNYGMGSDLYSPNTKYKAILQPDGNFVVYNINTSNPIFKQNAVWSTGTRIKKFQVSFRNKEYTVGLTKPTLSVRSDGNVIIYSRNDKALWTTGSSGKNVKLSLDNDGVLFVYKDNDPSKTVWSSIGKGNHKSKDWLSIASALTADSCAVKDPRNPLSGFDISKLRLAVCKTGTNLIDNSNLCGYLTTAGDLGDMDNSSRDIKRATDLFVKDILCAASNMTNASDKQRKFCSCFVPYSNVQQKLVDNGIATNCTDTCIMNGYHSLDQPKSCDSRICLMSQDLKNLMNAEYISQQCNIGNTSTIPAIPSDTPTVPATPTVPTTPAASNDATSVANNSVPSTIVPETSSTGDAINAGDASSTTTNQTTNTTTFIVIVLLAIILFAYLILRYLKKRKESNYQLQQSGFPMQQYMPTMQQYAPSAPQ